MQSQSPGFQSPQPNMDSPEHHLRVPRSVSDHWKPPPLQTAEQTDHWANRPQRGPHASVPPLIPDVDLIRKKRALKSLFYKDTFSFLDLIRFD